MQSLHKLCNMVYWLALALWLGALMSAGIAAGSTFSVLTKMDISIARYSEFVPNETAVPKAHENLAAGHVLEPVFWITHAVQFITIPLVILTLAAQLLFFRQQKNIFSNLIRTVCIIIAACLFAYQTFALSLPMNQDMRAYWEAAAEGDIQTALFHRSELRSRHETATIILLSTLSLVVIATAASAAAMTPLTVKKSEPILQTPQLAGNK
ncbi:MAG: hypothetical protein IH984_07735 [Planctomycetes bacterium]|nr:hypothetical protein [Planctomycetota bacterium]